MAGLKFGMQFDFRNPQRWWRPPAALYAQTLEFIAWTEKLGFDYCWISEHHAAEDGYMPSPFLVCAAVAQHTTRLRISQAIALAPLYHPVRLAEDAAVLDILSNGRMELGLGLGYKADEFSGYGISLEGRGTRVNELLQIVRRLWTGERVTFAGKYFNIENAGCMPLPVQERPTIWIGGFNNLALKRAARWGDGIIGGGDATQRHAEYVEALKAEGKPASAARVIAGNFAWLVVANDPEKTAREIAPHVLHSVNTYAQWNARTQHAVYGGGKLLDEKTLIENGPLKVLTPDQAVALIEKTVAGGTIEGIYGFVPPAGYPLEKFAEHVELFATKVMPHFKSA